MWCGLFAFFQGVKIGKIGFGCERVNSKCVQRITGKLYKKKQRMTLHFKKHIIFTSNPHPE